MDGYVALKRLKWGDHFIEAGEPVPGEEEGRNYASLLFHNQIGPLKETGEMSDAELAAEVERLNAALEQGVDTGELIKAADDSQLVALFLAVASEMKERDIGDEAFEANREAITAVFGDAEDEDLAGQTVTKATDGAIALAEGAGIDLATLTGTGEDGRIIEADVEVAIAATGKAEEDDVSDDKRVEIKKPEDPASVKKPAAKSKATKKPAAK